MSEFSTILRSLRKSAGITQSILAEDLEISRSAIGMYENGDREPNLEILESIADYFNVNMDYLIGRSSQRIFDLVKSEPSFEDIQSLILMARNGKKLTTEQKQEIMKTLLSDE